MLLKISYFLIVSLVVIGGFHFFYEWFQENLCTYFAFPKVKKTDKLFEFVETQAMETDKELDTKLEIENEKEEGKKGEEMDSEDLFQFIDGL